MSVTQHQARAISPADIQRATKELLKLPQAECPVVHSFGPGVYIRQITMPARVGAIGRAHRFEHMNVMLKGRALVMQADGSIKELVAPLTFVGQPGQKIGAILEEMVWLNIYATTETDIEKLEAELFEPSPELDEVVAARLAAAVEMRKADREDFLAAIKEIGIDAATVWQLSQNSTDLADLPSDGYKFVVSNSPISGRGVFASANIRPGEVIGPARIVVSGKLKRTPLGRYVNHSKTPNASFADVGDGVLKAVATRPIFGSRGGLLGDEITLDYRQAFAESQKHFVKL